MCKCTIFLYVLLLRIYYIYVRLYHVMLGLKHYYYFIFVSPIYTNRLRFIRIKIFSINGAILSLFFQLIFPCNIFRIYVALAYIYIYI